jgi:hypothetical protein
MIHHRIRPAIYHYFLTDWLAKHRSRPRNGKSISQIGARSSEEESGISAAGDALKGQMATSSNLLLATKLDRAPVKNDPIGCLEPVRPKF